MQLKEFLEDKKRLTAVLITVFSCIFLFFSSCSTDDEKPQSIPASNENPVYEIEIRLKNILESIQGAGKVNVFIMLDDLGTKSFVNNVKSTDGEKETHFETNAVLSGGSNGEPVLSQTRTPTVKGVIVTAQGASNESVRKQLKDAVCAALSVMPHRVEIATGK